MVIYWKVFRIGRDGARRDEVQRVCDTTQLDSIARSAIEMTVKAGKHNSREILKFRKHFSPFAEGDENALEFSDGRTAFIPDYWEDEEGVELTSSEVSAALTGNPNAVLIPPGFRKHDIDLLLAGKQPVSFAHLLANDELEILAYFVRDIRELENSSFKKDGPGTIQFIGTASLTSGNRPEFKTAVSDEEIRSHVTIFRRLYMQNDRGNLKNTVQLIVRLLKGHPRSDWIKAVWKDYNKHLNGPPDARFLTRDCAFEFSVADLLDAFIYTQYAHQPDRGDGAKAFEKCLEQVKGQQGVLTWLFCTELWKVTLIFLNVGRFVSWWFDQYCRHHSQQVAFVDSVLNSNPGIGTLEKRDVMEARLFEEEARRVAHELWIEKGRPESGPGIYLEEARSKLREAIGGT
ncbi:MAG: hypothetical protein C0483_18845 [Pirellula sp.]|nr:hypothetical protein [Pirellula sp.]